MTLQCGVMCLQIDALMMSDCELVRRWRNQKLETLRTPFLLTKEMQEKYYQEHVCNRDSRERFWAVREGGVLIAQVGFVRIEWENHLAEISNLCNPAYTEYRMESVKLQLAEGFQNMGFSNIYFESYYCDPALDFWQEVATSFNADTAILKNRKFWAGRYWDSFYFNITVRQYQTARL